MVRTRLSPAPTARVHTGTGAPTPRTGGLISHAVDLPNAQEFSWIADGLAFGGDYNPEQWPEEVWLEDISLMRRAGVNVVNLGVFSWGLLEVADGVFEWDWLDRVFELLHDGGIGVDLATPTASPPMWLLETHPEVAPVDRNGARSSAGRRLGWSPSSATFRRYALRMVRELAQRYGGHPALRMWHVSNEIGNENARCYSDETAAAWQAWLSARYSRITTLNDAWGTAFWGHHYTSFRQVQPPRGEAPGHNPGLLLDFERFTSEALLGHYRAERDVLRSITPHIPVTTNFMIMKGLGVQDYATWAEEVDLVANDHYTVSADPDRHRELSFSADRSRGAAKGRPWLLIEHSTSAVNWQPVNRAKLPGELTRDSLAHIARGADGALFFQWRMSTAGAEQFHSGMIPHSGADSKIFREVEQLGAILKAISPVRGSVVAPARVALLFDYEAGFALRSGEKPSALVNYIDMPLALHSALTARGIAVDIVRPKDGFSQYDAVVVPTLYLITNQTADELTAFVAAGGHALVTYFSGIVDGSNRVRAGGYPGALRELLGIVIDEFHPLLADEATTLDTGWTARVWTESLHLHGATSLAQYAGGTLNGVPAITRHNVGLGSATYLATKLDGSSLLAFVDEFLEHAELEPVAAAEEGVEVVRRVGDDGAYLFAINHADIPRTIRTHGVELITGQVVSGSFTVPPGGTAVVAEAR